MIQFQAKETETEQYEQQISQLKEDSQRALDQAAVENKVLQGQLEALENFRLNKDKLEAEMEEKEALIEQMKDSHSQALYKIEKKAVLDKDRCIFACTFRSEHIVVVVVLCLCSFSLFDDVYTLASSPDSTHPPSLSASNTDKLGVAWVQG